MGTNNMFQMNTIETSKMGTGYETQMTIFYDVRYNRSLVPITHGENWLHIDFRQDKNQLHVLVGIHNIKKNANYLVQYSQYCENTIRR